MQHFILRSIGSLAFKPLLFSNYHCWWICVLNTIPHLFIFLQTAAWVEISSNVITSININPKTHTTTTRTSQKSITRWLTYKSALSVILISFSSFHKKTIHHEHVPIDLISHKHKKKHTTIMFFFLLITAENLSWPHI